MLFRFLFLFLFFISFAAEARLPDQIPYRKGNRWGYCDSTKKMIIDPKYDYVTFFQNGLAVVSEKASFGIIDKTGKLVLGMNYHLLVQTLNNQYYVFDNGMLMQGLINLKGDTIIQPEYEWITPIDSNYYSCMNGKEMTIIDKNGKWIARFFHSDWETGAEYVPEAGAFIVYDKGKSGIVDTNGIVCVPFTYRSIHWRACGEFEVFKRSKVSYYSKTFQLQPDDYVSCREDYPFIRYWPVSRKGKDGQKQYGWHDNVLKTDTFYPQYEYTGFFHQGFAKIKENGKYGFAGEDFAVKIEAKYSNASDIEENGLALIFEYISTDKKTYAVYNKIGYLDYYGTEYWEE